MSDHWQQALEQSVLRIQEAWSAKPQLAIVLGSGLADVAGLIRAEAHFDSSQLPALPRSTAAGHRGSLLCGCIENVPAVVLLGRCHFYEGYSAEQLSLPVRLVHALGARLLVLTNASGGVNPRFRRGDVMVIRDHICLQNWVLPPLDAVEQSTNLNCTKLPAAAYDEQLAEWAADWARRSGTALQQGVYVALTGPNYETRSEYRMLRNLGGDAVGMSTAIEAVMAARLGIRTLALSMIANVALPDAPQRVTHDEVLAAGAIAEPVLRAIIQALVRGMWAGYHDSNGGPKQ